MLTTANKGRYVVKKCQKHVYVICEGSLTKYKVTSYPQSYAWYYQDLWRVQGILYFWQKISSLVFSKFRSPHIRTFCVVVSTLNSHPVYWGSNPFTSTLYLTLLISLPNLFAISCLSTNMLILWCHLLVFPLQKLLSIRARESGVPDNS